MANSGVTYTSYLDDVLRAFNQAKERALLAVAMFTKAEAILLAPVGRTGGGDLRQSIKYDIKEDKVLIGSLSKYAIYVEKGTGMYAEDGNGRRTPWVYYDRKSDQYFYTKGQEPQPFLRPAVFRNRNEIIEIFKRELSRLGN